MLLLARLKNSATCLCCAVRHIGWVKEIGATVAVGVRIASSAAVVLALLGAVAPNTVVLAQTEAAAVRTRVVANCEHPHARPVYKPHRIVAACGGDAVFILKHIYYRHWAHARANASAVVRYNSCTPDCANGHLIDRHATFALVHPRTRARQHVFTFVVMHSKHGPTGRYPVGR
jgi:hypothetical protein